MDTPNTATKITASMIDEIITSGYGAMVTERLEHGWEGYLITLMFNRIRGPQPSVIRQMQREVERVYATVLTRIIRNPRKIPLFGLPLWIVFPDYPVPKHAKMELRDVVLNGGLHLHGIALVPPWNWMNCGLDDHFEMAQELYVRRGHPLCRVHAVPITTNPGYVTGYALKMIPRRRLAFDDVLVLPRSHSEMQSYTPTRPSNSAPF